MIADWVRYINIQPEQEELTDLQNKKLNIYLDRLKKEIAIPILMAKYVKPDNLNNFITQQQKIKKSYEQTLTGKSETTLNLILESMNLVDLEIETAKKRLKCYHGN